jgi:hypothetical protein
MTPADPWAGEALLLATAFLSSALSQRTHPGLRLVASN